MARRWSRHKTGEVKISDLPKMNIRLTPEAKELLIAASNIENRPMWRIIDEGIRLYLKTMRPRDRQITLLMAQAALEESEL
jgi:hypothetical protein